MTILFYKVDAPYGCFSNFSPHPIRCVGQRWSTVEHYYQAQKFVGSPEQEMIEAIRRAETPEAAAAIGRDRDRLLRSDWENVKRDVMWQGVWQKFSTYSELQKTLLATRDEMIIENSPTDYYWGCGKDRSGRNELGKILMEVRQKLRY